MDAMKPPFEIPPEMRDAAHRSVQQARAAFETFIANAAKAAESLESNAGVLQQGALSASRKTLTYAEGNVKAAFDHAANLVNAKSLEDVMRLQSEFMQAQFAALQGQMQELGAAAQARVKEATEAFQRASKSS